MNEPIADLGNCTEHSVLSVETGPVATVPLDLLRPSDSPRLAGEDCEHARTLAESGAVLPPVLVHRATMRVIDGMHRLRAAALRGEDTIRVRFFDGGEAEAFVIAVRANVTHGLPLSLADRRVAAIRIVASHPHWSDRAIASMTGLAPKTVGMIRRCATGDTAQSRTRVGRDGRVRPLNSADNRRRASALMQENPAASLRQIATESGISLATVRDVRDRITRGDDPVPPKHQRDRPPELRRVPAPLPRQVPRSEPAGGRSGDEVSLLLRRLKQDPSLRFTETGRALIRLLNIHMINEDERKQLLDSVPEHCREIVAKLAHACAERWQELAVCFAKHCPAEVRRDNSGQK